MAAGLGFKTFNAGDILSASDTNGYLMQGVLVFASAAARDAAITSPQEGQFAYLKDTNVTTYYTGSAWANLDTTGMVNPMTTTGDTIYSSSGSTPARLGIGSTGQVLTVAGGVPSWATAAGGWSPNLTLLSTTTPSGSDFVTISVSSYDYYVILLQSISAAGSGAMFSVKPNSSNTAAHYLDHTQISMKSVGQTIPAYADVGAERYTGNAGFLYLAKKGNNASSGHFVEGIITVIGGKTTGAKSLQWTIVPSNTNNYNAYGSSGNGLFDNGAAITSFQFFSSDGNFNGGTIAIYGG